MATIIDPDNLRDAVTDSAQNIFINTALREVTIRNNLASGNANKGPVLDESGVTLQALYSFLKEEWKNDPLSKGLINYPFPLIAITPEQFEWRFGWKPKDNTSRNLLRTAGWREYATDNTTLEREFVGVISLGNVEGTQTDAAAVGVHTAYFAFFDADSAQPPLTGATNFDFPGEVNQAVKTYEVNPGAGEFSFDFRNDILTLFVRSFDSTNESTFTGYTFDKTPSTDIGITAGATLPYNVQRFPLSEAVDLDVTVGDLTITLNDGAGEKYDQSGVADGVGPSIVYNSVSVASNTLGYDNDLSGGPYNFGVIIDADDGASAQNLSKNEIYSWVGRQLRQNTNIEDSAGAAKIGRLQDQLLQFVGPDLQTLQVRNPDQALNTGEGVAIKNFFPADINNLFFRDDAFAGTLRSFPFTSTGTISFAGSADTLVQDGVDAKYFVYYEYTKKTNIPDLVISGTGSVTANGGTVDSANFTSATNAFSNANALNGTTGITLAPGDYFKVDALASNLAAGNAQVWEVISISSGGNFIGCRSYDDVSGGDQTVTGDIEIREHPINSPDALRVDSASGTNSPITGDLDGGTTLVSFTYDYDGNVQGDKPSGTVAGTSGAADAQIVIRAIGLGKGSYVEVGNIEIARSTSNSYSVVSAIERNYANPA